MPIHATPFDGAGRTYKLTVDDIDGDEIRVEDYWDRVVGQSWTRCSGNPAALKYAVRCAAAGVPFDDEVVYGKVDSLGHIVHVSELGDPA